MVSALLTSGCAVADSGSSVGVPPGSAGPAPPARAAGLLDPDGFAAAIAEPGRVVINVHVPFEGAIAGTDLTIAFDQIRRDVAKLPTDLQSPIAIYCRSGRMSAVAARTLAELGYTNVVELEGGMNSWVASGRVLVGDPAG